MTLAKVLNGYVKNMSTDYVCWRVTGELLKSIEDCPDGSLNKCMRLAEGNICPGGKEIKI